MSDPFGPDSASHLHKIAEHFPLLGMVAAARGGIRVELWHLVVAIIGLGIVLGTTFGGIVWSEAHAQTQLAEEVKQLKHDAEVDRANASYTRRRQEINEERISKLETDSALMKEFESRMVREHADIYMAIRNGKR